MGLFSFLKFLKLNNASTQSLDINEYVPTIWEDDYCQTEIIPVENQIFISKQVGQIEDLASNSRTDHGFTAAFKRSSMPVTTLSKKIKTNYLEKSLLDSQFQKAKQIRYNKSQILDCETGKAKAFGFSNFTIFFTTEDEFAKNIWIHIGLIVSVKQFDLIETALYTLGKELELILVDWNSLEFFNLADKTQIQKYLMTMFK